MTQSLPFLLRLVLSEPSVPCIAVAVAAQSAGADTPSTAVDCGTVVCCYTGLDLT